MWSESLTIYDSVQDIADRLDAESEEGMERLTIRSDICCEPENNIVYSNPNDPEGMYNILDLAECLYNGGEAEAGILLDISNRLAAYEDTGLTPKQIQEQQRYIKALEKQVEVEGQQAIIEAQQQEIEWLADETIKLMKENAQNSMRAESLTAEKDELIKVLKQARKALYAARVDVLTKETDELAREALAEIDKVMGGKEDA